MKRKRTLLLSAITLLCAATIQAEPGKGHGPGHGRMSDDFRGIIHELFANHDAFKRSVEITKEGYRAKTTSNDKAKAGLLQEHVAQMESRLDGGMGVRHWDPAFAELLEHYEDMEIKLENIEGGIAVDVTGKTPEAIAVAKNHAKIISGFIEKGSEQMHAQHEAVLGDSKTGSVPACGSCGKGECSGSCGKGKGKGKGSEVSSSGKGQKPCCADGAKGAKKNDTSK